MSKLLLGIRSYIVIFRWFILLILFLIHVKWDQQYSFGYTMLILFNLLYTYLHFSKLKNTIWKFSLVTELLTLLLVNSFFSLRIDQLLYLFSSFFLIGMVFTKSRALMLTFGYSVAASSITFALNQQHGAADLYPLTFLCGFILYQLLTYFMWNISSFIKKSILILLYIEKLSTIDTLKSLQSMSETCIKKLLKVSKCYICMFANHHLSDDWHHQYYSRVLLGHSGTKKGVMKTENYLGEPERLWYIPIRSYRSEEILGGLLLPLGNRFRLHRLDFILLRILISSFLNHWHLLLMQQEQAHSLKAEVRSQMAQDMHDGLAQQLFFLSAQVFQIKNSLAKGNVDQLEHFIGVMEQQASSCQKEVRSFIAHLKGERRDHNLHHAIEQLVTRMTYNTPVKISLEFNGELYLESVEMEETIYRIIEESIHNILKHAKATKIKVLIETTVVQWTIKIIDDGIGFDHLPKPKPNSYGLMGLRERVGHFGGHISLSSSMGLGTEMVAVIPRGGI